MKMIIEVKMKEEQTIFKCDFPGCSCQITKTKTTGFPYEKGWCYIYSFEGKRAKCTNPVKIQQISIKDKHFCSDEHMTKYIDQKRFSLEASHSKTCNCSDCRLEE